MRGLLEGGKVDQFRNVINRKCIFNRITRNRLFELAVDLLVFRLKMSKVAVRVQISSTKTQDSYVVCMKHDS